MDVITRTHAILYVRDQQVSTAFYRQVLAQEPTLVAPGMTEFEIGSAVVLGLMPQAGITRLLRLPGDVFVDGQIRGELYLVVDRPADYQARALAAGARELSALASRDWGDDVAYSLDLDGYVLAFARRSSQT